MGKSDLQALEAKIDALIQLCEQLAAENRTLRESQTSLISERAVLLEKNALARTRIETMIARLKSMEAST
jgi:cell division protein ZapB